jgi:hypothetical protein
MFQRNTVLPNQLNHILTNKHSNPMNMKWSAVGTSLDYLVLNDRTTVNNELEKM